MKGFALFELLIIMLMTILLYVFVQPSFQRYREWTTQAYAKHNLKKLYEAERQFYLKYSTYSSNLIAIGWKPQGPMHYHYGFPPVLIPKHAPQGYSGNYQYAIMNTENNDFLKFYMGSSEFGETIPSLHGNIFGHGVLEKDGAGIAYVAVAIGNLDNDEALDRFAITDQGEVIHLCNDINVALDDDPDCQHAIYNFGR